MILSKGLAALAPVICSDPPSCAPIKKPVIKAGPQANEWRANPAHTPALPVVILAYPWLILLGGSTTHLTARLPDRNAHPEAHGRRAFRQRVG